MSFKKATIKKVGFAIGGLGLLVGFYLGTLLYWSLKWDTPNETLPPKHLSYQDVANVATDVQPFSERAQKEMVDLSMKLQSVSISGAMMNKGELVWAGTVGLADVEKTTPALVNTQYRIGSVSKAVTTVVLMRMVEEGLIDLEAPIRAYLPAYPTGDKITARQLASHMSGVRHYQFDITRFPPSDGLSNIAYSDSIDALIQFKDDELMFEPGKGFGYSTHGYTLLSAVMQAAANKPFDTLIAEYVSLPLGLESMRAEHLLRDNSKLAGFYNSDGGKYGNTHEQNLSNKVAGGGLVSTPIDMVTLGAALLDDTLLTRASFESMTTVQPMYDNSENPQKYALGWRHYETSKILDEENKVDIIHHGGVSVGANSFFMLVPEHDIAIAIVTNSKGKTSRGEIQMLAYRLAGMAIRD